MKQMANADLEKQANNFFGALTPKQQKSFDKLNFEFNFDSDIVRVTYDDKDQAGKSLIQFDILGNGKI